LSAYFKPVLVLLISAFIFAGIVLLADLEPLNYILLISIFLTLFLTLYFLTNIKPNAVTLVRNRIKTLRANLFEQLYVNKEGRERAKWVFELEQRREEIKAELKHNLKITREQEKIIDSMIDNAWNELLAVIKPDVENTASAYPFLDSMDKNKRTEFLKELEILEKLIGIDGEIEELEELIVAETSDEIKDMGEIEEIGKYDDTELLGETGMASPFAPIAAAGRGLLNLASRFVKNTEEEPQRPVQAAKGLLKLAAEARREIEVVSPQTHMFAALNESSQ
jgi:hypothetical protein